MKNIYNFPQQCVLYRGKIGKIRMFIRRFFLSQQYSLPLKSYTLICIELGLSLVYQELCSPERVQASAPQVSAAKQSEWYGC